MIKLPYLTYDSCNTEKTTFKGARCPLVYLFVCENGMVIYVGRTDKFATRWKQHLASDKALHLVHRIELHVMDSDAEAHFYETEMILKYQPIWNKVGRHAKPSKMSVEPVGIVHYKATAVARFILPYARQQVDGYVIKHWDHGEYTRIDVTRPQDYKCIPVREVGSITVKNDLSDVQSEMYGKNKYFSALVDRVNYCAKIGASAYAILYDEIGFVDAVEPSMIVKCYWSACIKRERAKDFVDYSDYRNTGITTSLQSPEAVLAELDYVPDISEWYN